MIGDFGGQLYAVPDTTLVAQLLAELGLARPAAQNAVGPAEAGGYLYFGEENLTDHDADVVLVWNGSHPLAVSWILDDLAAVLLGEGTAARAPTRRRAGTSSSPDRRPVPDGLRSVA